MIAQTETTLQANRVMVENSSRSGVDGAPSFGSALAEATHSGARVAARSSVVAHSSKKPGEKEGVSSSGIAKGAKPAPAVEGQPGLPSTAADMNRTLPLQPAAKVEQAQGNEENDGGDYGESAVSALDGASHVVAAGRVDTGAVKQQGAQSVAQGSTGAVENRPVVARTAAGMEAANGDGDEVSVEASSAQAGPESGDSTPSAPAKEATDDEGDAATVSPEAGSASDATAAAMLGYALPTTSPTASNPFLSNAALESSPESDTTLGSLAGLGGAASKSGLPSGSLAVAKTKSGSPDGSVTPLSASNAKNGATEQNPASSMVTPADASIVTNPTNVHAAGGDSAAQPDPKAMQHGSGGAGGDSASQSLTAGAPQSWDASATQVVHRAQLIQAMHQSEMRMGMTSAEFGNISISAAVNHQTLSAQISLDHPELSRALTAHLPEIEKKLGSAYGLQSRVEVRDGSTSGQQGTGPRDGQRSQGSLSGTSTASMSSWRSAGGLPLEAVSPATYSPAAGMRLDILI